MARSDRGHELRGWIAKGMGWAGQSHTRSGKMDGTDEKQRGIHSHLLYHAVRSWDATSSRTCVPICMGKVNKNPGNKKGVNVYFFVMSG